jgi:4-amino-4-deoxy-L-arabinose transferase-like glycosyltransferase
VLLPLMFWPGSLLTAAGVVLAWKQSRRAEAVAPASGPGRLGRWLARFSDERPGELFLIAWLVPSWVVFELVNTKLPHYTMPLYPALALLSARAVMLASSDASAATAMGLRSIGARIGFGVWLVLGVALTAAAPVALARFGGLGGDLNTRLMMGALVGTATGCVVVAARALWLGLFARAQHFGLAAMVLAGAASFGVVLPRLHAPWVSPRLARIIDGADPKGTRPVAAVGYHEDSLKFLTNGRLDRLGWPSVREWVAAHPDGLVIVPAAGFEEKAKEAGVALVPIGRTSGFNYSKGDEVDLLVTEPGG